MIKLDDLVYCQIDNHVFLQIDDHIIDEVQNHVKVQTPVWNQIDDEVSILIDEALRNHDKFIIYD